MQVWWNENKWVNVGRGALGLTFGLTIFADIGKKEFQFIYFGKTCQE
jgi:hypothetical protein